MRFAFRKKKQILGLDKNVIQGQLTSTTITTVSFKEARDGYDTNLNIVGLIWNVPIGKIPTQIWIG